MTTAGPSQLFSVAITIINIFRLPFLALRLLLHRPMKWLANQLGFDYSFVLRSKYNAEEQIDALQYLGDLFNNAIEIQIAVGEMGHRLMERDEVKEGLRNAFFNNNAIIEISHGPRVDPKTQTVFEYAEEEMLTLHRMPEYARHHFILVRDKFGKETLIDEGYHNETLWITKKSGEIYEKSASWGRFYYMTSQAKEVIDSRRWEFERRKQESQMITKHPGLEPRQNYSLPGYFLDGVVNTPFRAILQPLSIIINRPIELQSRPWYKRDSSMQERENLLCELSVERQLEIEDELALVGVPDKVREWLDARVNEKTLPKDEIDKKIEALTGESTQDRFSILLFRELHRLENPDTSVGSLPIDNEAFAELVSRDIWTIDQLKEGFEKNPDFLGTYKKPDGPYANWRQRIEVVLAC